MEAVNRMTDYSKWKVDPKQVRNPDPRELGGRRVDGKPMRHVGRLFPKKKNRT